MLPEKLPDSGLIILRDGDPGEPEQALGGFESTYYQHAVEVEVYLEEGNAATRDAAFNVFLQQIGAVLEADPPLGGLAFGLTYGRPEPSIEAVAGTPAIKSTTLSVIRADGNAELIQFKDVALSEGVYTLTTLLRGCRGTGVFTGGHAVGDLFVLVDGGGVTRRPLGLDRLGDTLHYRAVGRGGELRNTRTEQLTLAGNDLKPYAPAHLAASGDFGADITLSWVRRTRVGGELIDGTDEVPLAEDTEERAQDPGPR